METARTIARTIGNLALLLLCLGTFWSVLVITP